MSAGPLQFKLVYRGNTVWLPPGQLFIGRSCACHIVIDDALVSRRHAQLTVTTRHVTLEDLNSINGVYLNAERLEGDPQVLREGDRIQIGNEELVFGAGARVAQRHVLGTATVSGIDAVVPAEAGATNYSDGPETTHRVDVLTLLGESADRAIAEGYVGRAEQMLSTYLTDILNEALAGKPIVPETYQAAMTYGLKLAWATRNGAWFDYVVELMYAKRLPPPPEYLESLQATLQRVGPVDMARLKRYVASLPSAIPHPDARQQQHIQLASELLQAAIAKQGE